MKSKLTYFLGTLSLIVSFVCPSTGYSIDTSPTCDCRCKFKGTDLSSNGAGDIYYLVKVPVAAMAVTDWQLSVAKFRCDTSFNNLVCAGYDKHMAYKSGSLSCFTVPKAY